MKRTELYIKAFHLFLKDKGLLDRFENTWDSESSYSWRKFNDRQSKSLDTYYKYMKPARWVDCAFSWGENQLGDEDEEQWEDISITWEELIYSYENKGEYRSSRFFPSDLIKYFGLKMNKLTRTL